MHVPHDEKKLVQATQEMVEICGVSAGNRGAAYKQLSQYIECGQAEGGRSLTNLLRAHEDRLSSHLFCPTDARFTIDFENSYTGETLLQAEQAARILTRYFNRRNFDLTYGTALQQGLDFGASILKITGKSHPVQVGEKSISHLDSIATRIVPPWYMGVENEGRNGFDEQEAILETVWLSKWDVWRRLLKLDATTEQKEKLFKRVLSNANKTGGPAMPSSFIQVLSTNQVSLAPQGTNPPSPGGIVQITSDPLYANQGPQVLSDQIEMHELWVKDDTIGDWLMIQMIAPDVIIAPRLRRVNEFAPGLLPYILVQPNEEAGYFWGRTEIGDLLGLQEALSGTMGDFKKLLGIQYDKKLSFEGFDGDPQELYDDFQAQGWINGRAGTKVTDLTPKMPAEAVEFMKLIEVFFDKVSGFGNILSGQGESGVRASTHANTLLKTASPRLRGASLKVERDYASFGDRVLGYMEAKDGQQYYTNPEKPEETAFILDQLPDDRQVMVDSHSSSPIYENDHNQLISFGLKTGLVEGDDAIEDLNFPNKDEKKRKWRIKKEAEAKLIQEHPELLTRGRGTSKK